MYKNLLTLITLIALISCKKLHRWRLYVGGKPLKHQESIPIQKFKEYLKDSVIHYNFIMHDEPRVFAPIIKDSDAIAILKKHEAQQLIPFFNIIIDTNANYFSLSQEMYNATYFITKSTHQIGIITVH